MDFDIRQLDKLEEYDEEAFDKYQDALLDQFLDVVPQFQKDFAAIRARVDKLQPYLQQAHRRIWAEDVGIDRLFHDPDYPRS